MKIISLESNFANMSSRENYTVVQHTFTHDANRESVTATGDYKKV